MNSSGKPKGNDLSLFLDTLLNDLIESIGTYYDHIETWNSKKITGADLRGLRLTEPLLTYEHLFEGRCPAGIALGDEPYRKECLDLTGANLSHSELMGLDLSGAKLTDAVFLGADLRYINFTGAQLTGANFTSANLSGATLTGADISRAVMTDAIIFDADLSDTNLSKTDLTNAELIKSRLISTDLSGATLSGVSLYGAALDDWVIDDVKCTYVYWGKKKTQRIPIDRSFGPGEFEELYKSLPTITYYFQDEFSPISPLIMDRVVDSINQRHQQFELRLDSLHSRGTPHAVFTVLHKEHMNGALAAIDVGYKEENLRLKGQVDLLKELVFGAMDRPQLIQQANQIVNRPERIDHMGTTFGNINSGRDTNIATDNAKLTVNNIENDLESLTKVLQSHNVPQSDIEDLKSAIESDQNSPEHKDQSFGRNVAQWFSNMGMKAGSSAWRLAEGTTAGTVAGLLLEALKAYYGWT